MSEIVERLTKATLYEGNGELSMLPEEAAAHIERLEKALTDIMGFVEPAR